MRNSYIPVQQQRDILLWPLPEWFPGSPELNMSTLHDNQSRRTVETSRLYLKRYRALRQDRLHFFEFVGVPCDEN